MADSIAPKLPQAHNRLILLLADNQKASLDVDIDDGASDVYLEDDLGEPTDDIDVEMQSQVREQRKRWQRVADGLQRALENQIFEEDGVTGATKLDAEQCLECARFEVWSNSRKAPAEQKARALTEARSNISGFNITKDSIGSRINAILEDTRMNLPKIGGEDSGDDDDDGEEVALYEPPQRKAQTEEELQQMIEMGEAEDDLMQAVQRLQADFFKKYKKWVDVPLFDVSGAATNNKQQHHSSTSPAKSQPNNNASKSSPAKSDQQKARHQDPVVAEEASTLQVPIEDMSIEDVKKWLSDLDIGEYDKNFKRTTGRLLAGLSKADVKDRFNGDFEAADILWAAMEERRKAATRESKEGRHVKSMYDAIRAPASSGPNSTEALSSDVQSYERNVAEATSRAQFLRGDLSSLKRAMNPGRPVRPSQQTEQDFDDMVEAASGGVDEAALAAMEAQYLARTRQAKKDEEAAAGDRYASHAEAYGGAAERSPQRAPMAAPAANPRGGGGGGRAGYGASRGGRGGGSAAPATSSSTTAPPARAGNRWSIVEYDDDDDN